MAPMIRCAIWAIKLLTDLAEELNLLVRVLIANLCMELISYAVSICCCHINLHSTFHSLLFLVINLLYNVSSHILQFNVCFLIFFANYTVNVLKSFVLCFAFWMLLLAAFTYEMLARHYDRVICLNIYWIFATWALYLFYRFKGFDGSLKRCFWSHCLNWCFWLTF